MEEEFNYREIFTDVSNILETVTIVHSCSQDNKPICVLGVLQTKEGLIIQKEMLLWLSKEFDIYCVCQKPPGDLYEYPALRFAQFISLQRNHPVLYLHTKGAAYKSELQKRVRTLWKYEFTSMRLQQYLSCSADVVCPLLGPSGETWYNGMLISPKAFQNVVIKPSENRYDYQRLFCNIPGIIMKGLIKNKIDSVQLNTFMMTMDLTFSGKPADFSLSLVWTPRLKKKKS